MTYLKLKCTAAPGVIDRYMPPAPKLRSKPIARRCFYRLTGQPDGRTDGHPTRIASIMWSRNLMLGVFIQEAQLSPRDRAMRRVNWNLASCDATVQKLLIRQVLTISMVWSWRFSRRRCVIDNVHSTVTRPSRFHCLRCVINKPTTVSCVFHLYTDDLLWRNFLSPQFRNCSRDPDHAHLGAFTHHKTKTSHGRPVYKTWSL